MGSKSALREDLEFVTGNKLPRPSLARLGAGRLGRE